MKTIKNVRMVKVVHLPADFIERTKKIPQVAKDLADAERGRQMMLARRKK